MNLRVQSGPAIRAGYVTRSQFRVGCPPPFPAANRFFNLNPASVAWPVLLSDLLLGHQLIGDCMPVKSVEASAKSR
jgi:hypothetical protein